MDRQFLGEASGVATWRMFWADNTSTDHDNKFIICFAFFSYLHDLNIESS